jgi:hypothetical protein
MKIESPPKGKMALNGPPNWDDMPVGAPIRDVLRGTPRAQFKRAVRLYKQADPSLDADLLRRICLRNSHGTFFYHNIYCPERLLCGECSYQAMGCPHGHELSILRRQDEREGYSPRVDPLYIRLTKCARLPPLAFLLRRTDRPAPTLPVDVWFHLILTVDCAATGEAMKGLREVCRAANLACKRAAKWWVERNFSRMPGVHWQPWSEPSVRVIPLTYPNGRRSPYFRVEFGAPGATIKVLMKSVFSPDLRLYILHERKLLWNDSSYQIVVQRTSDSEFSVSKRSYHGDIFCTYEDSNGKTSATATSIEMDPQRLVNQLTHPEYLVYTHVLEHLELPFALLSNPTTKICPAAPVLPAGSEVCREVIERAESREAFYIAVLQKE